MRLRDVRVGLPGPKPQPLPALVRHERLRESREGSALPGEETPGARLGGGGRSRQCRDDALAIDLEDLLLLAAHEVDVELTHADRGELPQLFDVLLDLTGHAETVNRFVVD